MRARELRRMAALLPLLACLCTSCCLVNWLFGKKDGAVSKGMSRPEARRALTRARRCLYEQAPPDTDQAIRLADSVIRLCASRPYGWEAYQVKAAAYQTAGKPAEAAKTATKAIQGILSREPQQTPARGMTELKTLLAMYVENTVAVAGRAEPLRQLGAWRAELRERYKDATGADLVAAKDIDAHFGLLRQMAEQHVGSRGPEREVQGIIGRYIQLFNRRDPRRIRQVMTPASPLAKRVEHGGVAALAKQPLETLYLASSVRVDIPKRDALVATATCDLLIVLPGGWVKVVPSVEFRLAKNPDGGWLIHDVARHP